VSPHTWKPAPIVVPERVGGHIVVRVIGWRVSRSPALGVRHDLVRDGAIANYPTEHAAQLAADLANEREEWSA
jgi:hypothetical protein